MQLTNSLVSLTFITLLFAMMFKWLPDAEVQWRDVWIGAGATALLFEVGKFLIGIYIGKQGLETTFGAAASLVVLLIWIYYSSQIVLLGAEFTRAYARRYGWPVSKHSGDSAWKKQRSALRPDDPLVTFARQSPVTLVALSFVAGWALSHPVVQRLFAHNRKHSGPIAG